MIRSKDENTTKTRKLDSTVPLEELPNLMRAMGYYPTEQEVKNMVDEVKYSNFAETTQQVNAVDIDTFIRLFVNHRPVYGIGRNNIEEAFEALLGDKMKEGGTITRDELVKALIEEGEAFTEAELTQALQLLKGKPTINEAIESEEMTAVQFHEDVLGFEEVEDPDEDEYGDEMEASNYQGRPYYEGDVIPEEDI